MTNSFLGHGFIGVIGVWRVEDEPSAIVNIYSSCPLAEKRVLWQQLLQIKSNHSFSKWCFARGYNDVTYAEERYGRSNLSSQRRAEFVKFSQFIVEMEVLALPLVGERRWWKIDLGGFGM